MQEKHYEELFNRLLERGNSLHASNKKRIRIGMIFLAVFTVGMIVPPGSDARQDGLYIHGSKGEIISDVEYNQAGELFYTIISEGEKTQRKITTRQNYTLEIEQLGRCIENGEAPFVSPDFSIRNAKMLDDILEQIEY